MSKNIVDYWAAYRGAMADVLGWHRDKSSVLPSLSAHVLDVKGRNGPGYLQVSQGLGGTSVRNPNTGVFTNLPEAMGDASGIIRIGTRPMIYVPSMAIGPGTRAIQDPFSIGGVFDYWSNLGQVVGTSLATDPTSSRFRRQAGLWAQIHLKPLEGHRGLYNVGSVIKRRRARLYLSDAGQRADDLIEKQRALMRGIFGAEDPLFAMEDFENHYLAHVQDVLKMAGPAGQQVSLAGVKDASLKKLRVFGSGVVHDSGLEVYLGKADEWRPFGIRRDYITEERHLYQRLPTLPVSGFKLEQMHPLVAGAKYGADVKVMRGMVPKAIKDYGTVYRGRVGLAMGPRAGAFAQHAGIYGGGVMITNEAMARGVSASTGWDVINLVGTRMRGVVEGTSKLGQGLEGVPGLRAAMQHPARRPLVLDQPYELPHDVLTRTLGPDSRPLTRLHKGAKLHRVEFTDTGMRLFFQQNGPGFPVGTPVAIPGMKGTATLGPGLSTKAGPIHAIAYGGKYTTSLPSLIRAGAKNTDIASASAYELLLGHYAARVRAESSSNAVFRKNLKILASMTGTQVTRGPGGIRQLHTGGRMYKGLEIDQLISSEFQSRLTQAMGMKSGVLAPEVYNPSQGELEEMFVQSGKYTRAAAKAAAAEVHGGVSIPLFESYLQLRPTLNTRPAARFAIKMRQARQLQTYFSDISRMGGEMGGLAKKAAGMIGGNIAARETPLMQIMASISAPLMEKSSPGIVDDLIKATGGRMDDGRRLMGILTGEAQVGANVAQVSLSNIRNKELFERMRKIGKSTGQVPESILQELLGNMGIPWSERETMLGTWVNVGDDVGKMALANPARFGGAAGAEMVDRFFVPNVYHMARNLLRPSQSGLPGDMRLPRYPYEIGADRAAPRSIRAVASIINMMEELTNPNATSGSLARRASMMQFGVAESIVGGKGAMAKSRVGGFAGGFFRQGLHGGLEGQTVMATPQGILGKFGGRMHRVEDALAGKISFSELSTGEALVAQAMRHERDPLVPFAVVGVTRHPAQTTQQGAYMAKLLLHHGERSLTRAINEDTVASSLLMQHLSQGDIDGESLALFLMKNDANMDFKQQQRLLSMVLSHQQATSSLIEPALRANINLEASIAHEGFLEAAKSKGVTSAIFQTLSGGAKKFSNLLRGYDVNEGLEEATGALHRMKENKFVAMIHTWTMQQQQAIRSAAGDSSVFVHPRGPEYAKKIATDLGLDVKLAHEADYLPIIYGFLKKRGTASKDALASIGIINTAKDMAPMSGDFVRAQERLARHLSGLAEAIPGTDKAAYLGLIGVKTPLHGGKIDPAYYSDAAKRMMLLSVYKGRMEGEGALNLAETMASGRSTFRMSNVTKGVMEQVLAMAGLGREVSSFPGGFAPGTEGVQSHLETVGILGPPGKTMAGKSASILAEINKAAGSPPGPVAAAQRGVVDSVAAFAEEAVVAAKRSKYWGTMRAAAAVGGSMALYSGLRSAFEGGRGEPQPVDRNAPLPPTPLLGSPGDGANPGAVARMPQFARIQRTQTQRTHFPAEDQLYMGSPLDVYSRPSGAPLPTVRTAPRLPGEEDNQ